MNTTPQSPRGGRETGQEPSSSLTVAELYLQRADFHRAKALLKRRLARGGGDFKTKLLLGISQARLGQFAKAAAVFSRLDAQSKAISQQEKCRFNLGLVKCYQDLAVVGDCSVARYWGPLPGQPLNGTQPVLSQPFAESISIWRGLARRRCSSKNLILTYLAFAYMQTGQLDQAIKAIMEALARSESFYITHFVLGRIFLDLYFLALEGNHFGISPDAATFFEVEHYEVLRREKGRLIVEKNTFLDIAMQAFLEGRNLNPGAAEISLGLTQTYLLAGMLEEAHEALGYAESLAQDSLAVMETSLFFQEALQVQPEVIRALVAKIGQIRRKEPGPQIYTILPPYYLY